MAEVGSLRIGIGLDSAGFQTGVNQVQAGSRRLEKQFSVLDAAATRSGNSIQGFGRSAQGGAGGIQNLSYQFQDLAVQIGAGTDKWQALGQQLPQLLSGFGAVGAILGVVAAVSIPVARYFGVMGDTAEEASEKVSALTSAMDDYRSAIEAANQTPDLLIERYGIAAAQARELLEVERDLARLDAERALTNSLLEADTATGRFALTYGREELATLDAALASTLELEAAQRRIAAIEMGGIGPNQVAEYDALIARLTDLRGVLDGSADVTVEMVSKLGDLAGAMGITTQEATLLARKLAEADDASSPREQAAAWAMVSDALVSASGGVSNLTEEGRKLYDAASAAQTAYLELAAIDLATPIGAGADSASELSDFLRDAHGWSQRISEEMRDAQMLGRLQYQNSRISGQTGTVDVSGSLVDRIIGVESGGNASADNPLSSALGLGQFIESTWLEMFERHFPDRAENMSREAILALRTDAATSRAMVDLYLQENANVLNRAGIAVTDANLYLAHFLGPGGAVDVLTAGATAALADVLDPGQIAANASILGGGRTVGDLEAWAQGKVGVSATEVAAQEAINAAAIRDTAEALREREQAEREAATAVTEQNRLTEAAQGALNGLVASLDPAAAASQQLAEAQATVADAVARNIITQAEGQSVLAAFAAQQQEAANALLATSDGAAAFSAAMDAAAMSAADMGTAKANILIGGIDGIADAFGGFIAGGLQDFKGFVQSILGSFQSMIAQMIAMAARNKIMLSLGIGGGGVAGTAATAATGGAGGIMSGASAAMSGLSASFMSGVSSFATAGMGGLTTALSGATASLGGMATALGAVALPLAAVALGFMAFRKTTKELDAGLQITIDGMDALVENFSKTETSRFFGLSKSTDTDYAPAFKVIADPIQAAYAEISKSVLDLASVLGVGSKKFANFATEISVSTKGMSDEEAAQAVMDALAGVSDELAGLAIAGKGLGVAGESATDTLTRVAGSVLAVDGVMRTLGINFDGFFTDTVKASEKMVRAAGGIDAFNASAEAYFQAFYSAEEQLNAAWAQLDAGFESAGMADTPRTAEEFRAATERLLELGEAGNAAIVMGLTPLFESIMDLEAQSQASADAIKAEADAKADAVAAELDGLEQQYYSLVGDTEALRKMELQGLDASNRGLQERIYALEDEAAATEAAAQAAEEAAAVAEAVATERMDLERRYYEAVGDTAALAAMARSEIDQANLAYYDTVVAAEAAAAALQEAQAAMEALDPSSFKTGADYIMAQARAANLVSAPGSTPVMPMPVTVPQQQAQAQVADATLAELKSLRAEVARLTTTVQTTGNANEINTRKAATLLSEISEDGLLTRTA